MTRAVVIKTMGDQKIGGAIEAGIRAGMAARPLAPEERRIVEAEMNEQRVRQLVRVAVGNTNTPEDYDMMTAAARADYGTRRAEPGPFGKAARWMLGVYGLLCWGIAEAYRKQEIVLGPHASALKR